jgi:hypothetical protein
MHAGNKDVSYRLEVFIGDRLGKQPSQADSYVVFDSNNPGSLDETTMKNLQTDILDKIDADNEDLVVYDVFSFYDTDKFLRYHKDADENAVGNSYASYDQTQQTKGIAYLNYNNGDKAHLVFADFSFTDKEVTADVVEDEKDDTTTEDTTTTTDSEMNGWLLASSIAIAAILLFAVVSIIVRRAVEQAKKNKARAAATQPVKAKVQRPVKIRKVEKEEPKDEPLDENDPYND